MEGGTSHHRCSASSSTWQGAQTDGSRTKPPSHLPADGRSPLEPRRKICPPECTWTEKSSSYDQCKDIQSQLKITRRVIQVHTSWRKDLRQHLFKRCHIQLLFNMAWTYISEMKGWRHCPAAIDLSLLHPRGYIFLCESWSDNVSRCRCSAGLPVAAGSTMWWYGHLLIKKEIFIKAPVIYCVWLHACWCSGRWYRVKDGTRSSRMLGDSPYKPCLISVGIRPLILVSLRNI